MNEMETMAKERVVEIKEELIRLQCFECAEKVLKIQGAMEEGKMSPLEAFVEADIILHPENPHKRV